MRQITAVFAVLLSMMLAACGTSSPEQSASSSAEPGSQSVASIGLGDVDTLLALGITPKLVLPWGDDSKEAVGEWAKPLVRGAAPKVLTSTGSKLDDKSIETIAASKPELIVAVNSNIDDETYKRLETIAPVVRRPAQYAAWSVPWQAQVRAIAAGVKKVQQGEDLINETDAAIAQAKKDNPGFQGKSAATLLPKSDGGFYAYSTDDGRGQILAMLGFVLPESIKSLIAQGSFYAEIPAENVSVLNLDALVYLDYGIKQSQDTAFRALPVVREGRMASIDKNLGSAMSMPNPVTIKWVLQQLPPKLPKFS